MLGQLYGFECMVYGYSKPYSSIKIQINKVIYRFIQNHILFVSSVLFQVLEYFISFADEVQMQSGHLLYGGI